MASLDSGEDDNKTKGNLWALDKTLDEPMDEEAGKLRDMHNEKVTRKKKKKLVLRFSHYSQLVLVCSLGRKVSFICIISVALDLLCLLGSLTAHCNSIGY